MKKIVVLFPMLALMFALSCSRDGSEPSPEVVDSSLIIKAAVLGDWDIDSIKEKSHYQCVQTGCVILNPDGSPKDTVRETHISPLFFFRITSDSVYYRVYTSGSDEKNTYHISWTTIEVKGGGSFKVKQHTSNKMLLTSTNIGATTGNTRSVSWKTYYLSKK